MQNKTELQNHVDSIAQMLTNPDFDKLNEGRDVENEGDYSAFTYLDGVYDIEYIVNKDGEYLGARILAASGGPNIWVDTRRKVIDGHWWGESASASFEDALGLDNALSELWTYR